MYYKAKKADNGFRYKADLPPNRNLQRLAEYLAGRMDRVRSQLEKLLGGGVKITGRVHTKGKLCTMTFTDASLGVVGQTDLVFSGSRAMPGEVRSRVYSGPGGPSGDTDRGADIEARKDLMKRISAEAERLFIPGPEPQWHVSYHDSGGLTGTKVITCESIERAKEIAYCEAPSGTDIIKLVTPDGETLTRTRKKRWTLDCKTSRQAPQAQNISTQ
jgi:hypothetical protein